MKVLRILPFLLLVSGCTIYVRASQSKELAGPRFPEKIDLSFSIDDESIKKTNLGTFDGLRFAGSANTYVTDPPGWMYRYTSLLGRSLFLSFSGRVRSLKKGDVTPTVIFYPILEDLSLEADFSSNIRMALEIRNIRGDLLYRFNAEGKGNPGGVPLKLFGVASSRILLRRSLEDAYNNAFSGIYNSFLTTVKPEHLKPVDHCWPKCWDIHLKDGREFRYAAVKMQGRTLEASFLNGEVMTFQMSSVSGMDASK